MRFLSRLMEFGFRLYEALGLVFAPWLLKNEAEEQETRNARKHVHGRQHGKRAEEVGRNCTKSIAGWSCPIH